MKPRAHLGLEACRAAADGEMHAYAGRTMIGTVLRCGRSFMAFGMDDQHRATTSCVRSAMRALSSGASA